MSIAFRPANDADFEYFWRLNRSCYREIVTRVFGEWNDSVQEQNYRSKWLEQRFQVILVEGITVGGFWVDEHETFHQLREIQIHPDHQGKGLGTQIIETVIEQANAAKKPVRLRVLMKSDAVRLYERLGFLRIGKNEHQYLMERAF